MAWKPDLESLFNDELVTDNINNSFLQTEKCYTPRPREHIEYAVRKIKLIEEKEKEMEKNKDGRKEGDEKKKNEENDNRKENEERKVEDIKKRIDRTHIFKLFKEYSKKPNHHSSALPDIIPEFPDLSLEEDNVVAGHGHNDCLDIEKESIQMMRSLGMGSGRSSYLDANRTISTHPITSSIIFPTSQYAVPILMDEQFFKFSNTAEKEDCSVRDINLLNSFEFDIRSYEKDPFAKAILENKRDDLNVKDAKEEYINHFPCLESAISKVSNPERASVSSVQDPLVKKNKRKKKGKNKKTSQKPEGLYPKKVKKRPTYSKLDISNNKTDNFNKWNLPLSLS
ncbi:uncharacterized protein LOC119662522 [Teleopsis dalmanni]|uniref:uncharacterized protein LOC119662522 n=1 Tax=Teleopsis dalmanni TaxID=139649 RepID=UPI0018CD3452|nr:uncharacterized protein LOC119662522 [Teleopsis dalmanni]